MTSLHTQAPALTSAGAWPGLHLLVLRPSVGTDASNNGISARFDQLTLIGWTGIDRTSDIPVETLAPLPTDAQVFTPDEQAPPVALRIRRYPGTDELTASIVPVEWNHHARTWTPARSTLIGGNYATTGDRRFHDLATELLGHRFYGALAIHDRTHPSTHHSIERNPR